MPRQWPKRQQAESTGMTKIWSAGQNQRQLRRTRNFSALVFKITFQKYSDAITPARSAISVVTRREWAIIVGVKENKNVAKRSRFVAEQFFCPDKNYPRRDDKKNSIGISAVRTKVKHRCRSGKISARPKFHSPFTSVGQLAACF